MTDVCVITGAARGLGALIAERFAGRGYAVLCTDIDGSGAAATAERIGGGAWALAQDVRDPESHRVVAREATSRGALRVWVNNAGVLAVGQGWTHADDELRRMVEVNVLGVMFGSAAAVDAMGASGGTLVNIGSISSVVPAPGLAAYGATKHAVLGFTTNLAGDLRRSGLPVRACCVCPDAMETDMVKNVAHRSEADLLFAGGAQMLTPEATADFVAGLPDKPRLVSVLPRHRVPLVNALRPFPGLAIRALAAFEVIGKRARKARGY